jgi:Enoyl-CoA hydratase/isomerase
VSDNTESAVAEGGNPDNPGAVLCAVDGPVAVVTINRPAARNAVNGAVAAGMAAALDDLEARPDVRVIVLTGAGGTFCAGMDLKGFLAGENPRAGGRGFAGIVERPPAKPVIAAVEGYALAGGFEVALSCDLIVASEEAAFGLPEVTRGLVAAAGGLLRLPRRIPYHLAMEVALTGSHPGAPAAPGWPDQPAGAGRAGSGRGHRAGPQAQPECAARPGRHEAGRRGVRRLAGGRGVRPAERDHRPCVRLGRRHRGCGRVRREAPSGLARPVSLLRCPGPRGRPGCVAWPTLAASAP